MAVAMRQSALLRAVFFLTCGGTKTFPDPRMNSLEAAFVFAKTSNLQVTPMVFGLYANITRTWRFCYAFAVCNSTTFLPPMN